MKILTLYYSESGQTEKIAKAIHSSIPENYDKKIEKLTEVTTSNLDEYDLIFVGTPCHSSDLAKKVIKFLEDLKPNPKYKLAGFLTHASYGPEKEGYEAVYERWVGKCKTTFETISSEKKIDFLGFFGCMGAPSAPIEGFIKKHAIPSEEEFENYLKIARKKPDTEDIENAQKFALATLKKLE